MIRFSAMVLWVSLGAGCDADFLPEKTGCTSAGGACDGDRDCVPFSCTCSSASKSGTISKCSSGKCSAAPCTSLCGSTKGAVVSSAQQPVPARCTGSPSGSCGDGKCDPGQGESCASCPHDCCTGRDAAVAPGYGSPCDDHKDCTPDFCNIMVGFGRGYCTKYCSGNAECAYPGSFGSCSSGMCVLWCSRDAGAGGCPPGLICNSHGVCQPS